MTAGLALKSNQNQKTSGSRRAGRNARKRAGSSFEASPDSARLSRLIGGTSSPSSPVAEKTGAMGGPSAARATAAPIPSPPRSRTEPSDEGMAKPARTTGGEQPATIEPVPAETSASVAEEGTNPAALAQLPGPVSTAEEDLDTEIVPETAESAPRDSGGDPGARENARQAAEETATGSEPEHTRSVGFRRQNSPEGRAMPEAQDAEQAVAGEIDAVQSAREQAASGAQALEAVAGSEAAEADAEERTEQLESLAASTAQQAGVTLAAEGENGDSSAGSANEESGAEQDLTPVEAALAGLEEPMNEVAGLTSGRVRFAPRPEESAPNSQVSFQGLLDRMAAEDVATAFLVRNAAHVENLLALAFTAPPRIQAVAGEARLAIDLAVSENIAMVGDQFGAARARARAEAATTRARLNGQSEALLAEIGMLAVQARERIAQAYMTADSRLFDLKTNQDKTIGELYDTWVPRARATGALAGGEAMAIARTFERGWRRAKVSSTFVADQMEARADAAIQVGEGYRDELKQAAIDQAAQIDEGRGARREAVSETHLQTSEALHQHFSAVMDSLEGAEQGGQSQVEAVTNQLLASVSSGLAETEADLDRQEAEEITRLGRLGEAHKHLVDVAAEKAIVALLSGAREASLTFSQALRQLVSEAGSTQAPDRDQLAAVLAEAQAPADETAATMLQQMTDGIAASEEGLITSREQALTELGLLGESAVAASVSTVEGLTQNFAALLEEAGQGYRRLRRGLSTGRFRGCRSSAAAAGAPCPPRRRAAGRWCAARRRSTSAPAARPSERQPHTAPTPTPTSGRRHRSPPPDRAPRSCRRAGRQTSNRRVPAPPRSPAPSSDPPAAGGRSPR